MNKLKNAFIVTALSAVAALPALGGASPHETVSATLGGNTVKITYGRPFSKRPGTDTVRKIWGGLVPWDKAWRLGADQATTLVCEKAIVLGGTTVPAGTYTLYMVPSESGTSKLAISKTTGQWGIPVDEKHDLGRVDLKKEALDPQMDQLTLSVTAAGPGGVIKIQWEKTQYSVDFSNAP
ncbi:MAG: DUF2911 domain-containing protein [Verrucomicrobiota bacterium]|jgi:hypothetical protein